MLLSAPAVRRPSLRLTGGRSFTPSPINAQVARIPSPDPNQPEPLPSLASLLRPQSVGNWLMPYLSAITPTYIEGVLRGGLGGNHVAMFQLFDLMWDTDPEIASCIGELVDGVLGKKLVITPYAEEGEEPSDSAVEKATLISAAFRAMRPSYESDENDIRGTIRDLLAAPFYGTSLLELDWYDTYGTGDSFVKKLPGLGNCWIPRSTYWVNPVCYGWDLNGRMGLRVRSEDLKRVTRGIQNQKLGGDVPNFSDISQFTNTTQAPRPNVLAELPPRKFLIGIHKAKTGSIFSASRLRTLAWWWVAKNFCGDWLLNYAQIFGIPLRKAVYPAAAPEVLKQEIRQMLQASASATWAMVPEGWELSFDRMTGGGESSPQAFLYSFADQQIRKVILRQTMAGGMHSRGTGVGKGGMETELEGPKDDNVNACADYVCGVFNNQLIPYTLVQNYGDDGDTEAPSVALVDEKVGGLIDAQRDQILTQILDIGEDYMRRKYDVPKPGDDEAICGQDMGTQGAEMQNQIKMQKQQMSKDNQEDQEGNQSDEQLQQQAEGKENAKEQSNEAQSRRATRISAASADQVLADAISPLVKRIEAINAIKDGSTQKLALQKLLKDMPAIARAMKADPKFANSVTAAGVSSFLKGLKK